MDKKKNLNEIIDFVLQEGINPSLSLEKIFSSKYWRKRIGGDNFPSIDEYGNIFPDLFSLGRILRKYNNDEEAISKITESSFPFSLKKWQLSILIETIGYELIKAGKELLPKLENLVKQWKSGDKENQIKVVESLFLLLRSKAQKLIPTTKEGLQELKKFEEEFNVKQGITRFLPRQIKKSGSELNCLGKEIQLASFFSRCSAKFYSAFVLKSLTEIECNLTLFLNKIINNDLSEREIKNDEAFEQSLKINKEVAEIRLEKELGFHTCLLVQLSDGDWILIDPYGISWGILPSDMQKQMKKIDTLLQKYNKTYPGLSLLLKSSSLDNQLKNKIKEFQNLLKQSQNIEMKLKETQNSSQLVNLLYELSESDAIIRAFISSKNDSSELLLFIKENGLKRAIEEIITLYHYVGYFKIFDWFDKARERGEIVHPVLEVINPLFSVGWGAISDTAIGYFKTFEFTEELAQVGFFQMALANVLLAVIDKISKNFPQESKLSSFAEKCLEVLNKEEFPHPQVLKTLKILKSLKKLKKIYNF